MEPAGNTDVVRATPSEITKVGTKCKDASDELKRRIGDLDRRLTQLLGESWTGNAGSEFQTSFSEWHEGASKIEQGLWALGELVQEAAREYLGTDTNNARQVILAGSADGSNGV